MTELSRAEYIRHVADAIHDTRHIKLIATDLSLPLGDIDWNGASRLVWSEVLTHAQRGHRTDELRERLGQEAVSLRNVAIGSPRTSIELPLRNASWSADWDVGREKIEKAALRVIEGSERMPFVVHGPRGYGKSWFLERLLARMQGREEVTTFLVPDTAFKTDGTAEDFFFGLVRCLAEPLDLGMSEVNARRRAGDADLSPAERFHYFVKSLPGAAMARTCLMFDVPDHIWKLPPGVRNDFFGKIREWKHARVGPLTALRTVVAFSLTPALMNDDPHQSNLSTSPFVLDGLSDAEVRALAALYGLEWTSTELAEVRRVLDGHPRYVRMLMHECLDGRGVSEVLAACHLPGKVFHNDLLDLREMLRSRESLWAAARRVAKEHAISEHDQDYRALLSAGLIRSGDGRRFDLRYELLARIPGLVA